MIKIGVIYKYTCPDGKVYIGQTYNETLRRNRFLSNNKYTSGTSKIDYARKLYGVENFKYEVLEKKEFNNFSELTKWLNDLERYYINIFNSEVTGYNSTKGNNLDYDSLLLEDNDYYLFYENELKLLNTIINKLTMPELKIFIKCSKPKEINIIDEKIIINENQVKKCSFELYLNKLKSNI